MEDKAGWWLLVGGAMIGVGSFLPWITATTFIGTLSRSGVEGGGDGVLTLGLGVVIALLGGFLLSGRSATRVTRIVLWVAIALVTLIWILDFSDIRNRIAEVDSVFASGSVGAGLWVIAIGAITTVVGIANLPVTKPGARVE